VIENVRAIVTEYKGATGTTFSSDSARSAIRCTLRFSMQRTTGASASTFARCSLASPTARGIFIPKPTHGRDCCHMQQLGRLLETWRHVAQKSRIIPPLNHPRGSFPVSANTGRRHAPPANQLPKEIRRENFGSTYKTPAPKRTVANNRAWQQCLASPSISRSEPHA